MNAPHLFPSFTFTVYTFFFFFYLGWNAFYYWVLFSIKSKFGSAKAGPNPLKHRKAGNGHEWKIPSPKEWPSIGTGCPGKWLSHPPGGIKNMHMWCLGKWLSAGLGSAALMAGPDDHLGLFQHKWFCVGSQVVPRWCRKSGCLGTAWQPLIRESLVSIQLVSSPMQLKVKMDSSLERLELHCSSLTIRTLFVCTMYWAYTRRAL